MIKNCNKWCSCLQRKEYADGSYKNFKDAYAVFGPTFVGKPTDIKHVQAAYKRASDTVTKLANNLEALTELETSELLNLSTHPHWKF